MSNHHQLCIREVIDPNDVAVAIGNRGGEKRICLKIVTQHIHNDLPEHIQEQGWVSLTEEVAIQLLLHLSHLLEPSRRVGPKGLAHG
jgi:hypothetical protein